MMQNVKPVKKVIIKYMIIIVNNQLFPIVNFKVINVYHVIKENI